MSPWDFQNNYLNSNDYEKNLNFGTCCPQFDSMS